MIKIMRYALIVITGFLISWSLASSPWLLLPIIAGVFALIWLIGGLKFPILVYLALPLYSLAVLTGFLYGGTLISQGLLFLLLLAAWETDILYRDSAGMVEKQDEIKLLIPLLIRELLSLAVVSIIYIISKKTGLRIGFWPLVALIVFLIFTLRKLFRIT